MFKKFGAEKLLFSGCLKSLVLKVGVYCMFKKFGAEKLLFATCLKSLALKSWHLLHV